MIRMIGILLCVLALFGCTTHREAMITIHADADWARRGTYAIPEDRFNRYVTGMVTNADWEIEWSTNLAATISFSGDTVELYSPRGPGTGGRCLLYVDAEGRQKTFIGGQCMLWECCRRQYLISPKKHKKDGSQQDLRQVSSKPAPEGAAPNEPSR